MTRKNFARGTLVGHRVISLFTGAGGLDLGLEAAGFNTSICVEMNPEACQTLRTNRDWNVIESSIQEVSSRKILSAANLKRGSASLLVGGPPCQPFSKSGYWYSGDTLRMEDPRALTVKQYLRVLDETLPAAFVLENVPGFAYEQKAEGLNYFLRGLKRINRERKVNYSANWTVLNAVDYGVPQRRERLFVVGSIDGERFEFPEPTHADSNKNLLPFTTAWDSIGDLEFTEDDPRLQLSGKWARLLPSIPEGWNYLWHTSRGGGLPLFGWRSRYWNFLLKLAKNQPSWTIQAQPGPATGPFHWKSRRLSPRELCRLQTFPENYEIYGELYKVQRQIGNAVPSALSELIGLQIRRQFYGEKVRSNLRLIPTKRLKPIRATHRRKVPDFYLKDLG